MPDEFVVSQIKILADIVAMISRLLSWVTEQFVRTQRVPPNVVETALPEVRQQLEWVIYDLFTITDSRDRRWQRLETAGSVGDHLTLNYGILNWIVRSGGSTALPILKWTNNFLGSLRVCSRSWK